VRIDTPYAESHGIRLGIRWFGPDLAW
jgi:hypothetical protein